jgi:hypothetical protein
MPRPFSTRRSDADDEHFLASRSDVSSLPEPAERLRRLAALVAVGETPLPADLEPAELSIVLAEVARLRRDRLVRLVARAIAWDLRQPRES